MNLNKEKLKAWYKSHKINVFFGACCGIWFSIILFIKIMNTSFDLLFSDFSLVVNNIDINKLGVIIAPIIEESMKLFGYVVIFLIDFNKIFNFGYSTKRDFINDNAAIIFLIWVGIFGFQEGFEHNLGYPIVYLWAFWMLNTLIHITYSIYPFIFGRKYNNSFVYFLPIAIILHSVHNFIIIHLWDNKWVTFSMVTLFLLPIVFLERKHIVGLFRKCNPQRTKIALIVIGVIFYLYIFLSLLLAFRL